MENLNVKIEKVEGNSTLTVFKGEALTPKAPLNLVFNGDMYAPILFWEKRIAVYRAKTNVCHVEIDKENFRVKLVTDENDPWLKNEINGEMQLFADFLSFKINQKSEWDSFDLAQHCRMNKYLFDDASDNAQMVTALMNIKAKVKGEVEKYDSKRGDTKNLVESVVNHNIPNGFILNMEVIKGLGKIKFFVEINVKFTDSTFHISLISPELKEIIDGYKAKVISEIVERFGSEIAILYK
jgi:hypothetical protein